MTKLRTSFMDRLRSLPLIVASLVGVLLLLANLIPRAKCEKPVSQDGLVASYANGDLQYGWPKLAVIHTITQASNHDKYLERRLSISHLLGLQKFKVATISRSEFALVANTALAISMMLLLAITIQSFISGKFSIRYLFAAITLLGIITAASVSDCPLL